MSFIAAAIENNFPSLRRVRPFRLFVPHPYGMGTGTFCPLHHRVRNVAEGAWAVRRYVAIAAAKELVASIPGFTTEAQLQEALDGMDLEGLHDIKLDEFQELMGLLVSSVESCNVQDTFRRVLTAYFLSLKDWEGQLRSGPTCYCCFGLDSEARRATTSTSSHLRVSATGLSSKLDSLPKVPTKRQSLSYHLY